MRKVFYLLIVFMFLVSCSKEADHFSLKDKKAYVEYYEMTKQEKKILNLIGESSNELGIFKLNIKDSAKIHSLEAKIRVYEKGKLIDTIGGMTTGIMKEDKDTSYLTFKRNKLNNRQTNEWKVVFASENGNSSGTSMYKQPHLTNLSSFGSIDGKQEILKGKEMALGAIIETVDSAEVVVVNPEISNNERLFKNNYVYLFCIRAK